MGNRCSISVRSRPHIPIGTRDDKEVTDESVSLFRHWGGSPETIIGLVEDVFEIMMRGYRYGTEGYPAEIIALLTTLSTLVYNSSAYLGVDEDDGDNSDNGHYILEIGAPHNKELNWRLLKTNFDWDKYRESDYKTKTYDKPKRLWSKKDTIPDNARLDSLHRLSTVLNDLELI